MDLPPTPPPKPVKKRGRALAFRCFLHCACLVSGAYLLPGNRAPVRNCLACKEGRSRAAKRRRAQAVPQPPSAAVFAVASRRLAPVLQAATGSFLSLEHFRVVGHIGHVSNCNSLAISSTRGRRQVNGRILAANKYFPTSISHAVFAACSAPMVRSSLRRSQPQAARLTICARLRYAHNPAKSAEVL